MKDEQPSIAGEPEIIGGEQPSVSGEPELVCEAECSLCPFVSHPGCPKVRASKRYVHFDLSHETSESATRVLDIAKQVARTEGNRLPGRR